MGKYEPILKIVEYGTIGRAASAMGYTQSSLSYVINHLEQELGTKIFHRDRQGTRLTEAGEDLLPYIRQLEELDDALHRKAYAHQGNVLRVGIISSVSTEWIPGIVERFREKNPNTEIHVIQENTYAPIAAAIEDGRLDCGFYAGDHNPKLDFFPLFSDRYYVIVRKEHELVQKEVLHEEDLAPYYFISPDDLSGPGPLSALSKRFSTSSHLFLTGIEDIPVVTMVEKGFGFSIMPSLLLRELAKSRNIVLVPFEPEIRRTLGLLSKPYHTLKPVTRSFIQITKEFVKQWADTQAAEWPEF